MSMITPLHLLLFGARTVTYEENMVVLDDWYSAVGWDGMVFTCHLVSLQIH